jgi:hypothetical protein
MLQDFRHHLWQKHFLEHLPAYDGANFRGDDGFRLNVDAYAEGSWIPKPEAVFFLVVFLRDIQSKMQTEKTAERTLIVVS